MKQKNINKKLEKVCSRYSNEIKSIAHVGAHLGQEIDIYKKFDIKNIYLFEPQKSIFLKLQENTKNLPNVKLFNTALGSIEKKEFLNKASENDGASSSILEPALHKDLHEEIKFHEKEEIDLKRFDSFGIEDVNFLTIDVQGFELEVIKGFGEKIKKLDFIFTEINKDYVYKNNVLIQDLDSELNKHGFLRIKTYWDGYLPYGDAFYVRKRLLTKKYIAFSKISKKFFDSNINLLFLKIINYRKLIFKTKKYLNRFFRF
tara:strand:- start:874 stop:1650 length:777 start_codon:yes stop_codon:yes gene_type:complete